MNRGLTLLLISFLLSVSIFMSPIRFSRADTTIYIYADGSIFPPTAPITTVDNVSYVFSNDIVASIQIQRDNIVLLSNNHTLKGTINAIDRVNVTVEGITISGIINSTGQNNRIIGNNVMTDPTVMAGSIVVWNSSGDIINGNTVHGADIDSEPDYYANGIWLNNCTNCTVQGNTVRGCQNAISCWGSDIIVRGNNVMDCRHGIAGSGDRIIIDSNSMVHFYTDREPGMHSVEDTVGLTISGTNGTICHNLVANSSNIAISLNVVNSTVVDNKAINSAVGFRLAGYGSELINNTITGNVASMARAIGDIYTKAYGLIVTGNNIILRNNTMERNEGSFGLNMQGDLSNYINDVDTSNRIDGEPIYYWINKQNLTIPTDAGYVALVNCSDITVRGLDLTHNGQGVFLAFTANSTITSNNVTNNRQGIFLHDCPQPLVLNNSITNDGDFGIKLESSPNSAIYRNTIAYDDNGIILNMSDNTRITDNTIMSSGTGIYFDQSSFCVIYHNNFVQNPSQAVIASGSNNTFDNGYPSGGNYWSDYVGVDAKSTGIGFPYYTVYGAVQDLYPLMGRITSYDAGVWQDKAIQIDVESSSSVSGFQFDESAKVIMFNVEGPENTTGFCRITVPKSFLQDLWQSNISIFVSGTKVDFENFTDTENAYLYFTYKHSEHTIVIVPEYSSTIIAPLLTISLTLTIKLCRKTIKLRRSG
jgi:parallel beta-helix repeat protein